MGLLTGEELLERDRSWWRPWRWLRVLLLVVLVAGGSLIAWSAVSDLGTRDDVAGGDPGAGGSPQTPSPEATSPPDEPTPPAAVLGPGSSGAEVLQWQQLLADAGLDIQADGVYGRATTRATRRFQRTIGEEPTGRPTTRTLEAAQRASSLRLVTVYFVRDGQLDGVRRRVEETQLARGALEALVAGPLGAERDTGLSSAIPTGTAVGTVRVDRGVATVSLTGFAEDPGPQQLRQRVDQVVRTLTRFPSIEAVRFRLPADDSTVFAEAGVAVDGA